MTWRDLLRRRRMEEDLAEEIEAHIELQTRKYLAAGLDKARAKQNFRRYRRL
jgi:hypothetical protein